MRQHRLLFASIAALAILGGACSSSNEGGNGGGGTSGGGSTHSSVSGSGSGSGGSTPSGGSSSASKSGGAGASGGASSSGGSTESSSRGGDSGGTSRPDSGGTTSPGGTSGTAGKGGNTNTGGTGGQGGTRTTGGATAGTGGGAGVLSSANPNDGGPVSSGGTPTDGGGGTCTPGSCLPGNAPIPSSGCGKALGSLKTGSYNMTSGGSQRKYAIDIPTDYDPNRAYRLFFTFHWIGASQDVLVNGVVESINGTGVNGGAQNYAFYGLKKQAELAKEPAIFIAPSSSGSTWTEKDHPYFDDLLAMAKDKLCIDTSRVFATGFSFGAMITYSLSLNHQKDIRAGVGMAPANYNIYLPTDTKQPIAWMSTTGMDDGTCPFDSGGRGGKYTGILHATNNGCTVPTTIPTTSKGSKTHLCYDYQGCKTGYPVKTCTFDGTHQCNVADGGITNDGLKSWIPSESWKFFTQF